MSSSPFVLARREFLRLTSLSGLAAFFAPLTFAQDAKVSRMRLAIGIAALEGDGEIRALAAESAPDGTFLSRDARVTILGARGVDAGSPRSRRIVDVLANFAYFDGARERLAPFRAWASNRVNGAQGGRTSFVVPVHVAQQLDLGIVLESDVESVRLPLVLSLRSGGRALVRGSYVLVPLAGREAEPDWSAFALRDGELVDRTGAPAPFESFVIAVDYAR